MVMSVKLLDDGMAYICLSTQKCKTMNILLFPDGGTWEPWFGNFYELLGSK